MHIYTHIYANTYMKRLRQSGLDYVYTHSSEHMCLVYVCICIMHGGMKMGRLCVKTATVTHTW